MSEFQLTSQMVIPKPLTEVFAVFEDPHNLARITPVWLRFRIHNPDKLRMAKGLRIRYTIQWMGVPLEWQTVILADQPPHLFVDGQEQGPYRLWLHTHRFEDTPEGILVSDEVRYRLRLGLLGTLGHRVLVRQQLLAIFR